MTTEQLLRPSPSPLQALSNTAWEARGLQVYIKRDDLLAPAIADPFCGNKWRKLQYNLAHILNQPERLPILTFGGPYSNHIAAVASAGRHFNIPTIGVIRGEVVTNPTLTKARTDGMQLHFIDRTTYRQKHTPEIQQQFLKQFGKVHLIPEGGTNALALKGCTALGKELAAQLPDMTHLLLACGTGGTLAGVTLGLEATNIEVLGISALKGNFLTREVEQLLNSQFDAIPTSWQIFTTFHHGGYAKAPKDLVRFINQFQTQYDIPLEPVYTGKVAWALDQLIAQNYFPEGSRVVLLHSGGLQGLVGGLMEI